MLNNGGINPSFLLDKQTIEMSRIFPIDHHANSSDSSNILFNCWTIAIKTEPSDSPFDKRMGTFLCTHLPSKIPVWMTIVDRVTEPGYYGEFDAQDLHIHIQSIRSADWNSAVLTYLDALGFEGVETVEWRTLDR